MKEILEDEGYEVSVAANGLEAFKELAQGPPPCVILLDLMMPVMNGAEFLENKRRLPSLAAVPVYLMTASAPAIVELPGIQSILRKPFAPDQLRAIVERHC